MNGSDKILPNVSYCENENEMHYNPLRNDVIEYRASVKLTETTSNNTEGLHTNAFNTTIKLHTFENGVGKIEFDEDVTSIGNYAFSGCSDLTSITIPNSVTSFGFSVFQDCINLVSVNLSNNIFFVISLIHHEYLPLLFFHYQIQLFYHIFQLYSIYEQL